MLLLLGGLSGPLNAQDVDGLISLMESGKRDSVETVIEDLSFQYPGHPGIRYVRALLQKDALVAAGIYKDIIRNHDKSPYLAPALMRLGEYYYAQGLYIQSRSHLMRFIRLDPEPPELVRAVNLSLRAGMAARQMDSVYQNLGEILNKYPNLAFDIPDELDLTRIPSGIYRSNQYARQSTDSAQPMRELGAEVQEESTTQRGEYVLQAGAFSTRANADRLSEQIQSIGYSVMVRERVIAGRTLFLVWVGNYNSRDEAQRDASLLETALDIKSFPTKMK